MEKTSNVLLIFGTIIMVTKLIPNKIWELLDRVPIWALLGILVVGIVMKLLATYKYLSK